MDAVLARSLHVLGHRLESAVRAVPGAVRIACVSAAGGRGGRGAPAGGSHTAGVPRPAAMGVLLRRLAGVACMGCRGWTLLSAGVGLLVGRARRGGPPAFVASGFLSSS